MRLLLQCQNHLLKEVLSSIKNNFERSSNFKKELTHFELLLSAKDQAEFEKIQKQAPTPFFGQGNYKPLTDKLTYTLLSQHRDIPVIAKLFDCFNTARR